MSNLAQLIDLVTFRIPFGRWQLVELTDLWILPPFVKHDLQDLLTVQWTKRVPLLQGQSPAELAADIVHQHLQQLLAVDNRAQWSVIDFASGNGGPVPLIEMRVNQSRAESGLDPIPFRLSDLDPHLNMDAWMTHAARSNGRLSFIPQPVDAANPSFSTISVTTPGDKDAAYRAGYESSGDKVYRLYCAAFHRFDDQTAARALQSTLKTSDAFAVVELQERTSAGVLLAVIEALVLFLTAIFWFWRDPVHLIFTYLIPLVPVTQLLDDIVACLRTRTFEEFLDLIIRETNSNESRPQIDSKSVEIGTWTLRHTRVMHTWPLGYMNVITGTSRASE